MSFMMDIGVRSRDYVDAVVASLFIAMETENENDTPRLDILSDDSVLGGEYSEFSGASEQLLTHFRTSKIIGFRMFFGWRRGRPGRGFILVSRPFAFGSLRETWSIVADKNDDWDESLLDKIIEVPDVEYAAICVGDSLDLDNLAHVNKSNFPWGDWRLRAGRVSDPNSGTFVSRNDHVR